MSARAWLAIGGGLVLAGLPGTALSVSPVATASTLAASRHGDPVALAPALVTKTIARTSAVLVEVRTNDGEVVLTTPEHPFALVGSPGQDHPGWARADRLSVGDDLVRLSPGGPTAEVTSVKTRHGRPIPVFNLVVSRVHAYAVGQSQLLVHNGKCKTPEEIAADRRRFEELVAERTRLKKDGDPEGKLAEVKRKIRRMQEYASKLRKWESTKDDPVQRQALVTKSRLAFARWSALHHEKRASLKREKYHQDPEFRERSREKNRMRYRENEQFRNRELLRTRDRNRRLAILARLREAVDREEGGASLERIPKEAVDAEVRELEALLRGPGGSAEPDTTDLRQAVEADFGDLERQLESGAGGEAATTSNLERDFGLEEQTFEESLSDVHDRISAYDSMSEEVAAFFPGLRDELVAEERNLVNRRCAQLQSEMEVTHHQLMLMRDIPEFHDAAAEGALEHQLQTLTAELGTLAGAPP